MSDASHWALSLGLPTVVIGAVTYIYRSEMKAARDAIGAQAALLADLRKDHNAHAVRLERAEATMLTLPVLKQELGDAKREIIESIHGMKRQVDIDMARTEAEVKQVAQDQRDLRRELAVG